MAMPPGACSRVSRTLVAWRTSGAALTKRSKRRSTRPGAPNRHWNSSAKLYQIERKARGKLPDGQTPEQYTYLLRQERSREVLDAFYVWLVKNQKEVLPKSPIGKAIGYTLGQWKYLVRYVDDGRVPADNN